MPQNSEALASMAAALSLGERRILIRAELPNGISNPEAIQIGIEGFQVLKDKGLIQLHGYRDGIWVATDGGKALAELLCPACFGPMGTGLGLDSRASGRVYAVECRKCHACGFSEGASAKNESNELPQPGRDFRNGEMAA